MSLLALKIYSTKKTENPTNSTNSSGAKNIIPYMTVHVNSIILIQIENQGIFHLNLQIPQK